MMSRLQHRSCYEIEVVSLLACMVADFASQPCLQCVIYNWPMLQSRARRKLCWLPTAIAWAKCPIWEPQKVTHRIAKVSHSVIKGAWALKTMPQTCSRSSFV